MEENEVEIEEECEEEAHSNVLPDNTLIIHLDSAVQSLGIKISAAEWLDMGNENYGKVPDEIKAAAYQAAIKKGYQDRGILVVLQKLMGERYDASIADFVLNDLKELAQLHPATYE